MIRVEVAGVAVDPFLQAVVILRQPDGRKLLHIWIGPAEAQSIAMHLEGKTPPRPLSHDLLSSMLSALKVQVTQVVIHDLQDNTFYAEVHLKRGNKTYQIDARPSDAIALAIRTKSPIYVTGNVIEAMVEEPSEEEREEVERFRKLLEDVDLGEDEPEEE